MPTNKKNPDGVTGDPGPTLPHEVTGSAVWIVQRLADTLRDAVDEAIVGASDAGEALTLRGYWLLETIGATAAHSQRELCDLLRVDRSDMVRLIDALEDAGFVARTRDTEDRRRQLIGLTEAGAAAREAVRAAVAAAEADVFAAAPAAEIEALSAALDGTSDETDAEADADSTDDADADSADDSDDSTSKKKKKKKKKKDKKKKKGGDDE